MSKQVNVQIYNGNVILNQVVSAVFLAEGYRRIQAFVNTSSAGSTINVERTSATLGDIFNNTSPPDTPTGWSSIGSAVIGGINIPIALPFSTCTKYVRVTFTATGGPGTLNLGICLGEG